MKIPATFFLTILMVVCSAARANQASEEKKAPLIDHAVTIGLCTGSAGCWGINCNSSIECESAGCGACTSDSFAFRISEPKFFTPASFVEQKK